MSKTICFFNTAIPWGGGEKWHYETALFMQKQGHQIVVVCHKKSSLCIKLKESGIKSFRISVGNISFLNPFKLLKLFSFFKKNNVGVVVLNLSRDVKLGGLAALMAKTTRKIYFKGSANPVQNSVSNKLIYKYIIDEILVNSQATKACVLENNPTLFNENYIKTIPHGVDINTLEQNEFTPYYTKKGNELVLVSLGRLEKEKNHTFLVDVSLQLRQKGVNFKLLIGGDGSLMGHLKSRIKENHLEDFVLFVGFVKNPINLYKSGDILLLPSLYEGFGFVIVEAALCKVPTIAFDNSSKPEVIKHKSTGILTKDNDLQEFCDGIMDLNTNRSKIHQMGENAYAFAKKTFSLDDINKKLELYLINGFDKRVTALITTYNEEKNIEKCIKSVSWADEILVIDSFSTDNTVSICKKLGAKVLQREYNYAANQKNWAIPQATHPWIVLLDADEITESSLEKEIKSILKTRPKFTAYWIQRRNYFLGKKVRFCGWQNDHVVRFFHRDFHIYENKMVHEEIIQTRPFGILKSKIIHNTTSDLKAYTQKIERYAHFAAQEFMRKSKRITIFDLYIKPAFKFLNSYIIRGGIFDGKIGWIICKLRTRETWLKAKIASEQKNDS